MTEKNTILILIKTPTLIMLILLKVDFKVKNSKKEMSFHDNKKVKSSKSSYSKHLHM